MSFTNDQPITKADMDQMQTNLQWLYDNTPRSRFFRFNGTVKDNRTLVVGGTEFVPRDPDKDGVYKYVRLGNSFAPNCSPIVTTGINADFTKKIFCAVTGPNGSNFPTNGGFDLRIKVAVQNKKLDFIRSNMYIHWIAMGFRRDDMNEF